MVLTVQNASLHHLPESVQEMADVIGLHETLLIVQERGGIRLCVPTKAKQNHWLSDLIGIEAMKKLVEYYCGEEIEIPRCAAAIKAAQEEEMYKLLESGMSQPQVAKMFGYTERTIRRLKVRIEERQQLASQESLF